MKSALDILSSFKCTTVLWDSHCCCCHSSDEKLRNLPSDTQLVVEPSFRPRLSDVGASRPSSVYAVAFMLPSEQLMNADCLGPFGLLSQNTKHGSLQTIEIHFPQFWRWSLRSSQHGLVRALFWITNFSLCPNIVEDAKDLSGAFLIRH